MAGAGGGGDGSLNAAACDPLRPLTADDGAFLCVVVLACGERCCVSWVRGSSCFMPATVHLLYALYIYT